MKTSWRASALALVCLLAAVSCSSAFAADQADPAVIQVGNVSYPLSEVQFALSSYSLMAEATGVLLTEEEKQEVIDQTVDHFVSLGIIENKLAEFGVDTFTEDEMDILRAQAAVTYEQNWQQLYQTALQYGTTVSKEEITSWMNEIGYTQDAVVRELMVRERESRILDLYCSDVTVTQEEAQAYYLNSFLNPAIEKYRDNVPLYEQEILLTGQESVYTPEGYRYLKNILLAFPEEIQTALNAMQARGKKIVTQVQTAYDNLARAAADGEDIAPYKEIYDRKVDALHEQEEKYREKEREAIPLLQDTINTIREQLASGISIDTLLKEYSLDQQQTGTDKPGMLYHPDSQLWQDDMKAAVNAMTAVGELSEPFADEEGVHLMYYAGDAPGGERILTAEEQQQLMESALYAAQLEKLTGLIETWKADYDIVTDTSLLYLD